MSRSGAHRACLHALAAALCAVLLLVALGLMDANGAPWWALVATQGLLLVTTASAGMWLDRWVGERRGGAAASWGGDDVSGRWGQRRSWTGTFGDTLPVLDERVPRAGPGRGYPQGTEDVFWQERMGAQREDKS